MSASQSAAWPRDWRDRAWDALDRPFDLAIVGGGITGAGILGLATRLGLRAVLVEQADFASGTSSRSSKLVHGGLRYLAHGQVGVTRMSVVERERLLREAPGLVEPLGFLMPTYRGDHPGRLVYTAGLTMYDLLAGRRTHRHLDPEEMTLLAPHIATSGLNGGFRYGDAQTDDARLTMRVILEAVAEGGLAINYATAEDLPRTGPRSRVAGVVVRDLTVGSGGRAAEIHASVVINATGAWADGLRARVGSRPRIRPLRGSHLVFPAWRLPVAQAVSFLHPADRRPVFVFPWEGVSLLGTTDVDHPNVSDLEPSISAEEAAYLLEGVCHAFPSLGLGPDDVLTTFAGVRPVIGSGKADPSDESREHVVWNESGLLTVTGGKLTTFGAIARDAVHAVAGELGTPVARRATGPLLEPVPAPAELTATAVARLSPSDALRLAGRYGRALPELLAAARPGELEIVPGTPTCWAELRWAARGEPVVHLEDLLLRRTRLGILLGGGGLEHRDRVRSIVRDELGWDDERWGLEEVAYRSTWLKQHGVPGRPAADSPTLPSPATAGAGA